MSFVKLAQKININAHKFVLYEIFKFQNRPSKHSEIRLNTKSPMKSGCGLIVICGSPNEAATWFRFVSVYSAMFPQSLQLNSIAAKKKR